MAVKFNKYLICLNLLHIVKVNIAMQKYKKPVQIKAQAL